VDTLTSWTLFGQAVILLMIQLGGLGFMTVIYLMACMLRRKLSLHQRLLMVSAFNLNDMNDVGRVVVDALKLTFAMEGVGAVILALCFMPRYGLRGIWKGVFIAVSAYCNAGFDLLGPEGLGSISSYNGQPIVLFTVMALVVGGGLGFFVWKEIREKRSFRALSLYSKMVIWLTGSLVVFGWVFFLCAEWSNQATLGAMPIWKRVLNALFQSVTLRTAGFAAIDQGGLTEVSQVLSILLMLVGGSSGSTAGGLKTVTVGVLLLALKSCLRGREEVTFRERTIPQRKVLASLTLVLVVGAVFIVSSMAIAVVDGATYLSAAFEAASAIATVGLTTGITSGLSPLSHLMLICMMYLGRVGILSFSLAFLTQSGGANKIGYPETSVMIG
jgi:trk system potassium uptake protein TrkH